MLIEANDLADAARRPYRMPIVVDVVELDEEIAWEKRLEFRLCICN